MHSTLFQDSALSPAQVPCPESAGPFELGTRTGCGFPPGLPLWRREPTTQARESAESRGLAELAWKFESTHHEPIRREFARTVQALGSICDPEQLSTIRKLRSALEHHFYRSERLLFPEMRRIARMESGSPTDIVDPTGVVERGNRDLRRMLSNLVETFAGRSVTLAPTPIPHCLLNLIELIAAFLVLEQEQLLPRCRRAFHLGREASMP